MKITQNTFLLKLYCNLVYNKLHSSVCVPARKTFVVIIWLVFFDSTKWVILFLSVKTHWDKKMLFHDVLCWVSQAKICTSQAKVNKNFIMAFLHLLYRTGNHNVLFALTKIMTQRCCASKKRWTFSEDPWNYFFSTVE